MQNVIALALGITVFTLTVFCFFNFFNEADLLVSCIWGLVSSLIVCLGLKEAG